MKWRLGWLFFRVMRLFGYTADFAWDDDGTLNLTVSVPSMRRGMWWPILMTRVIARTVEKHAKESQ